MCTLKSDFFLLTGGSLPRSFGLYLFMATFGVHRMTLWIFGAVSRSEVCPLPGRCFILVHGQPARGLHDGMVVQRRTVS